jgi:hypothetical protein
MISNSESKESSLMKSANNNFNNFDITNLDDEQQQQLFEKLKHQNIIKIKNKELELLNKKKNCKESIKINVYELYKCFGDRIEYFFPDSNFIKKFNEKNDTHFEYKKDFIEQIKCFLPDYYEKKELFGDYAINLVFLEILSEKNEDISLITERHGRAKSNDHMKYLSKKIGLLNLRKDIYEHLKKNTLIKWKL